MPSDWLFYWMTLPNGLAAIGAAVALPFVFWAVLLGKARSVVGYKPLALAYLLAAIGLLLVNFGSSYLEFSSRVASNALAEDKRWSTVLGWTVYTFVLSLVAVLPLLGLLGVPAAALLVRTRRLSVSAIACGLLGMWFVLSGLAWAFPSNEWHRTHRMESLLSFLSSFALPIAFVGLPFLGGIYAGSSRYRASSQPILQADA
jgi:hypothetical protein